MGIYGSLIYIKAIRTPTSLPPLGAEKFPGTRTNWSGGVSSDHGRVI